MLVGALSIDLPSAGQLLAAVPVIAATAALLNVWVSTRNERRRTQPLVIAHGHESRSLNREGDWFYSAYLKNEGGGPAFNVRLGIELDGVRLPYRMRADDPAASRQRVLASGAVLPEPSERASQLTQWRPTFSVNVSHAELFGTRGDPDPGRIYWCRYENAFGQTWETRNPADRGGDLRIRRVRSVRWREWCDRRAVRRLRRRGEARMRQAVGELREGLEPESEGNAPPPDPEPPSGESS